MAATSTAVLGQFRGYSTVATAFPQTGKADNLDLIQIVAQGESGVPTSPTVLCNVDYAGTVHYPASGATDGTRIGQYRTTFGASSSPTKAQLFANAFTNPSLLDIIQVVNSGDNVHYYLDYTGTAYGS
jgi:hypothetical protein